MEYYLKDSQYDEDESRFLIQGSLTGFPIGYQGPTVRHSTARNIPSTLGVGDKVDMWNKIMKEVSEGRVAGPYREGQPPYQNYIQSPIGLVPKSSGKTRLIFHLSHNFSDCEDEKSLNYFMPQELCTTKYNDLDYAVRTCFKIEWGLQVPSSVSKDRPG